MVARTATKAAKNLATGFVLAGGKSTRLGQDKVLLAWEESTLLENALGKLRAVCNDVYLCTNREELNVYAPVLADVAGTGAETTIGPLGGMVAALEFSETDWNVFLPVDLPLLPVAVPAEMLERALAGTGVAWIPYLEGRPQPLCAVVHRGMLPGLRRALAEGKYKVIDAMESAAVELAGAGGRIECYEIEVDSGAEWFLNVNTPQELERAQALQRARSQLTSRPVSS